MWQQDSLGNEAAYTVSQDTVNGVHTVRGESYTSFNMPAQMVACSRSNMAV